MKVLIEIPKGSNYKYEVDKTTGQLTLDRVISLPYPANYGFVLDTLAQDGDQLDVFILSQFPINPLTIVEINVIGGIDMVDNGVKDEKIIATIKGDFERYGMNEIESFLKNYKSGVKLLGRLTREEALKLIDQYGTNHPFLREI